MTSIHSLSTASPAVPLTGNPQQAFKLNAQKPDSFKVRFGEDAKKSDKPLVSGQPLSLIDELLAQPQPTLLKILELAQERTVKPGTTLPL